MITATVGDFVEFNIPVHLRSELRNPMLSNRFFDLASRVIPQFCGIQQKPVILW